MNPHDFVDILKIVIQEDASKGIVDALRDPPGRKPDPQLLGLSKWFHRLPDEERSHLLKVVEMTAQQATYNVLLMLDGLIAIESESDKGSIELIYRRGESRVLLNDPDILLSDLFKSGT